MIKDIINLEWEFFQQVHNIGGRASCQDDYETFLLQRTAQFEVFYEEVRESYLHDLRYYKNIGRNPIEEKYARMMRTNDPENYEQIKKHLIELEQKQEELIDSIVSIELSMREEVNVKYPKLTKLARKTYSYEDSKEETSFETYLRGELSTYSPHTLYLYGKMIADMVNKQENIVMKTLERTAIAYGYSSLVELNL